MKKHVCSFCGHVYDPAAGDPDNGVPAGTPWKNVPDDWVCPSAARGRKVSNPLDRR